MPSLTTIWAWLGSTPRRTFVLYPLLVIGFELLRRGILFQFVSIGVVPMIWGYLQYRLTGRYRRQLGGGGPGLEKPPDRIVDTGPYAYVRNPMYLGHLIFMFGLAVTFWSPLAVLIFVIHAFWFHRRVLGDEAKLIAQFGEPYRQYMQRVQRWIPGLL